MIINAINGNGNRLIRVNKDTNKDAVKEFLVTTLSQCDTNGHFIETPYSESKLLDKYLGEVVLNIYVTNLYPERMQKPAMRAINIGWNFATSSYGKNAQIGTVNDIVNE